MGLLDTAFQDYSDPYLAFAQKMFAAGAPSTRRIGLGEALAGGLSGIQESRNQNSLFAQKKSQDDIAMQLRQMQLGQLQQQMQDSEAQKTRAAELPNIIQKFGNDYQGMMRAGVPPEYVKQLADSRNYGINKVARVEDVAGDNGLKVKRMLDDYGNPVGTDLPAYVSPVQVDSGSKIQFEIPQAGLSINKTASPDTIRNTNLGYAQINSRLNGSITHGVAGLSKDQNEALFGENGAVTNGRLDPNRINSKTASILADAYLLNPNTDMSKISADISLNRNSSFRQRALSAEILPEVLQNMVDAGKKVDFSKNRTIGKMQQWMKGEFNDPDLTSYMAQRNDALMTLAGVMRQNGMTDMAHRAETEAASPTMDGGALDAWMAAQNKALQPRLRVNQRITRDTPQQNNATNATQKQVVKTGMYNGKKVVQYDDGTVEYVN